MEKAPAGAVLHAVAEEVVETRKIEETIGWKINLPVKYIARDAAMAHFV